MSLDTILADRLVGHVVAGRVERDNTMIRLSGAGACSRQIGYVVIGVPREEEPLGTLVTFEIGHAYHAMVQQWLVKLGMVAPDMLEVPLIDQGRRLRGTCDAITVRLNGDGEPDTAGTRRVIEIKSISNLPREIGGRMVAGAFDSLDRPKEHHLDQANCYAAIWNQQHPDDPVTHLTFVYVAKDGAELTSPFKVFTVPISLRRWERLQRKFAHVWERLDAGELPGRDHDPYSAFSVCRFCGYKALCLEAESQEG